MNDWSPSLLPQVGPPIPFGNRCGHDPSNPQLSPPTPIKKGPGGLPRILSLAAERAKDWFFCPSSCPPLNTNPKRQTRSERREACQIILEVLLSRLDLASLCVGTPTPSQGFIDIDMKTIVRESGLGQRRCERAISLLKEAGFLKVTQRRGMTSEGKYFGLRAIRVFTVDFFEWLGLGTMLKTERKRASEALLRKAKAVGKTLSELMGRLQNAFKVLPKREKKKLPPEIVRNWTKMYVELSMNGLESEEAKKLVNDKFGYPAGWSPGHGSPW